jgi:hypothetical protein
MFRAIRIYEFDAGNRKGATVYKETAPLSLPESAGVKAARRTPERLE